MDVYDAIPTIVTTFVAIISKISVFIFLLELVYHTNSYLSEFSWTYALLISSLLSLIIGTVVGLTQFRIKRLLAYSTISHVGFILLALSASSIESTQAFIFYLIQYSISNLNIFIIIITIGFSLYGYITNNKEHKDLLDKNNSPAEGSGKPHIWDTRPNSRDLLKLPVPSRGWKANGGWTNHSCKVISRPDQSRSVLVFWLWKIIERAMEYRGSKSIVFQVRSTIVKEQRVDGRGCVKLLQLQVYTHLRYALMGFERNYQIRIPSNQLISLRRSYTSLATKLHLKLNSLNPWFITGFSDGESNFTVRIIKNSSGKGWTIQPVFQISLHKKDLDLLKKIQASLGVGAIYTKEKSYNYMVQSLKDINVIVNHFEKYPLLTKKREDFLLFAQIVSIINKKEHLTLSGLHKVISFRASMNLGLSEFLRTAFPDVTPAIRPKRTDEELLNSNINPHWMIGFTAAEGCFSIRITKSSTTKIGYQVQLRYQVTQHSIDKVFMNSLVNFWGCGKVFLRYRENKVDFQILKFKDILEKVVPLFISMPGEKSKDFYDFYKAVEILKVKGHLTEEGLNQIRILKAPARATRAGLLRWGMNRGRDTQ